MWKIAKISDKQQGIKRDNETFKKEMKPVFNVSFILLSITGLLIFLSSPFIIYFLVELYS